MCSTLCTCVMLHVPLLIQPAGHENFIPPRVHVPQTNTVLFNIVAFICIVELNSNLKKLLDHSLNKTLKQWQTRKFSQIMNLSGTIAQKGERNCTSTPCPTLDT